MNAEREKMHEAIGTMKTNSTIHFDMINPKPEMVVIEDIAQGLGMICRYNGQVPYFYSVAQHSCLVADWLNLHGYDNLALTGLLHDSAEAYVGDIVRPMKRIPSFMEVYSEIEKQVELAIGTALDVTLYPMNPIVKDADHEVYLWEIENIRTGRQMGWDPEKSVIMFIEKFHFLFD